MCYAEVIARQRRNIGAPVKAQAVLLNGASKGQGPRAAVISGARGDLLPFRDLEHKLQSAELIGELAKLREEPLLIPERGRLNVER